MDMMRSSGIRKLGNRSPEIAALAFLVLFLFFPTQNSSVDAWFSAASVRWNGEIFHPHHLLYNAFAWLVARIVGMDTGHPGIMVLMKGMNAFYAFCILLLLGRILHRLDMKTSEVLAGVVFTGSSFAVARFATENETYLLPLLFSLLSVWLALRTEGEASRKLWALFSGTAGTLSILAHEIHLFWWTGMAIYFYLRDKKNLVYYLLPALAIPMIYYVVWRFMGQYIPHTESFVSFVLYDFREGMVQVVPGFKNLWLALINLLRTFYQVHGYILYQFRDNLDLFFPVIGSAFLFGLGLLQRREETVLPDDFRKTFIKVVSFILLMQFLWAVYSVGNAEFMVMIPALVILYLAAKQRLNSRVILCFAGSLLIWNFFFGILPMNRYPIHPVKFLTGKVEENPGSCYILKADQLITAAYYYETGTMDVPGIWKSPDHLLVAGGDTAELRQNMRDAFSRNIPVYTDCTGNPALLNRDALISSGVDGEFFEKYRKIPVDSVRLLQGYYTLYRLFP